MDTNIPVFNNMQEYLDQWIKPYMKAIQIQMDNFSGGGVPIGSIVIWTWHSIPQDWLVCHGQAVDGALYPKLREMTEYVPDYRGYFLRGYGGSSDHLGVPQSDTMRNLTGSFGFPLGSMWAQAAVGWPTGVYTTSTSGRQVVHGFMYYSNSPKVDTVHLDASRMVPTSHEFRPINKSVNYIIRAK